MGVLFRGPGGSSARSRFAWARASVSLLTWGSPPLWLSLLSARELLTGVAIVGESQVFDGICGLGPAIRAIAHGTTVYCIPCTTLASPSKK